MKNIRMCYCMIPELQADSKGMAVCLICGNYFNKEVWKAYHNAKVEKAVRKQRIGRNCHCQCQSGKKFKKCCAVRKLVGLSIRSLALSTGRIIPALDGIFDNKTIHEIPYKGADAGFRPTLSAIERIVKRYGQLTIYVDRELKEFAEMLEKSSLDNLIVGDTAAIVQDIHDTHTRTGGVL